MNIATSGAIRKPSAATGESPRKPAPAGRPAALSGSASARRPVGAYVGSAPPRLAGQTVKIIALFLAIMGVWAGLTRLDEVTRGSGRVIPSSRTQVIQSSEAGVVREILVRQGQRVARGEMLLRLDDTPNAAKAGESEAQLRTLKAQIARLELEQSGSGGEYACPAEIQTLASEVCANEARLMSVRNDNLQKKLEGARERVEQRQREIGELQAQGQRMTESLALAEKELAIIAPMASRNLVSQLELFRAQRQVVDLRGQMNAAKETRARLDAALREATLLLEEQTIQFRREALGELTQRKAELSVILETLRGAEERVRRTDIRSPVDGFVNSLAVNTVGAYVNAGEKILDIVPAEDKLLIEARVKPSDIAFITPGQRALVKVSAYDFYQYGGLEGFVDQVSADSVYDPNLKETFYVVLIRSKNTELKHLGKSYPIIPGMTCDVDIITGEKSILSYILKPFNRARHEALTER